MRLFDLHIKDIEGSRNVGGVHSKQGLVFAIYETFI